MSVSCPNLNVGFVFVVSQGLNKVLRKVNKTIRNDSRVSSNPILRVTSGDECFFLRSLPRGSPLHSSAVWSCRERLSLLSLMHIVEHNDQKEKLPLLWKFLQKVNLSTQTDAKQG